MVHIGPVLIRKSQHFFSSGLDDLFAARRKVCRPVIKRSFFERRVTLRWLHPLRMNKQIFRVANSGTSPTSSSLLLSTQRRKIGEETPRAFLDSRAMIEFGI